MVQISERRGRSRIGKAVGTVAAALLCLAAFSQPNLAYAERHGGGGGGGHGGGGFHGGGFHAGAGGGFRGGGGFHAGGFHAGGFRPGFGEFHGGGFHGAQFRGGWYGGVGWGGDYPSDGYYDYAQPSYSQTWYYCADPAGYYPYVTQCTTGWQAVLG